MKSDAASFEESTGRLVLEVNRTGFSGVSSLKNKIAEQIAEEIGGVTFVNLANPSKKFVLDLNSPGNTICGHIYSSFDPHQRSVTLQTLTK